MNQIIEHYFQSIELGLITDSHLIDYKIVKRVIANDAGQLRIRCDLINHDILEFFNYVTASGNTIILDKYSFHWQNEAGELKQRWDNAPHHLQLANAPHHLHIGLEIVQAVANPPNIFQILQLIQDILDS